MTAQDRRSGQCLCGAVRFEAVVAERGMGACHCGMCRRWSGGVFLSVACAQVYVADPAAMAVHASSAWGERCFCKTCGSSLMWRSSDGAHIAVSVQCFDDPAAFPFATQIFIDDKPGNYHFREETQMMTGAEVIATFTPGGTS